MGASVFPSKWKRKWFVLKRLRPITGAYVTYLFWPYLFSAYFFWGTARWEESARIAYNK